MGKYCGGVEIERYRTLGAAVAACSKNVECGCIYDRYCDDDTWWISKGYQIKASSTGSCAWTPSKLMFPLHTRRLMYFTYNYIGTHTSCQ